MIDIPRRKKPTNRENPALDISDLRGAPSESILRRWLFRLLAAVLVPLFVLTLVELTLRFSGFGHPASFFVPRQIQGEKVLVENGFFGLSFFPPALARGAPPIVLRARKPPGTYRIFLFGESAALGDPRPAYGVGRYLETLLQDRFPQTKCEVVCVAVTAINSHAILPIGRECARYEGDLWVVYMGNNEMLGPFGASTVFGRPAPSAGLVRLYLALQRTRLGQVLAAPWQKSGRGKMPQSWGGMRMFLDQQLPPLDPRRRQVCRNFQANLASIIDAGIAAGVPVIVSSVASNLKDCPPFGSLPPQGLTAPDLARFNALLQAGAANQANEQFTQALHSYQEAARITPCHPELQFRLGECFLRTGNNDEARRCFVLARDFDTLPFRADSHINRIIAETATRYADKRAFFLDAERVLAASSPVGIPGEESFYEHVHLNFSGNYRLARALASVVAQRFPAQQMPAPTTEWADEAACARRLALTDWNRQPVLDEIKSRLLEPPFSNQPGQEKRLQRLDQQRREVETRLRAASPQDFRRLYEEALKSRPADHWLHHNYAEYLTQAGDLPQAASEMEMVCRFVPQHYSGYFHAGRILGLLKRYDEAIHFLETAMKLRPEFTDIYLEIGRALVSRGDKEGALRYCRLAHQHGADDGRVHVFEAKILESLKRRGEAVLSLREAIRLQPDSWEAHDMLGAELAVEAKFPEAQVEFERAVSLKPEYAEGHLNLGIVLARQGRFADALEQFHETLRLEPQNRKAQEFLSAVEQMRKQQQ